MPLHRSYFERVIQVIDLLGGRVEGGNPLLRFRRRAFIVLLLILALVCVVQAITAWVVSQSWISSLMMIILFVLVISCLVISRRTARLETTAAIVLSFLVIMGAVLEIMGGRSPNTPLISWSPVIMFGGFVFCGFRRGIVVAGVTILSVLAIIAVPFLMQDARVLPGDGTASSFQKRLFVTVILCHLLPLAIVGMYEKFFELCHAEARALFDKLESRKDRVFLRRLAQVLVREIEPEFVRMERAYQILQRGEDVLPSTQAVLEPLQKMVQLTRRYEPLAVGALAAIDEGLTLDDFSRILSHFTDFSAIRLEGARKTFRFQGGQSFFLLIFLGLTLRELMGNPEVRLQQVILRQRAESLDVTIQVFCSDQVLHLSLAQDFLYDLGARIHMTSTEKGPSIRSIGIDVPWIRLNGA